MVAGIANVFHWTVAIALFVYEGSPIYVPTHIHMARREKLAKFYLNHSLSERDINMLPQSVLFKTKTRPKANKNHLPYYVHLFTGSRMF